MAAHDASTSIVCVCACAFIQLHIIAQSGPVIPAILYHSHWSSQGEISGTYYENLCLDATNGMCVCTCVCVYLYVCLCLCICVCVFIKLRITAQSGPVILVILCH